MRETWGDFLKYRSKNDFWCLNFCIVVVDIWKSQLVTFPFSNNH